jgi:hypothetical protein
LPAQNLIGFLQANLKGYRPAPRQTKKKAWEDIHEEVAPLVLMILKGPAGPARRGQQDEGN